MSQLVGAVAVLLLLGVFVAALVMIWRAPFRALGILVAGMAAHNIIIMALLRLGTPNILVRLLQAWKEGILLVLFLLVLKLALQAWRDRRVPAFTPPDLVMAAFTLVALLYFVLPASFFGSHVNLSQRALSLRVLLLLPLLYLFGRVFSNRRPEDIRWNLFVIAGSAALVGLLGFVELWLIPTRAWLDGGVNLFSSWLGFQYHGPAGLPENFFQSAGRGLYLRRMVSTYISPLPIAYTGLLVVPLAVGLMRARSGSSRGRSLRAALLGLLLIGMLFSVTRFALFLLVPEILLLALIWRSRQLLIGTVAVAGLVAAVLFYYPRIGPLVTADLQPVNHRGSVRIVSSNDPSLQEHSATLASDLQFVIQHPLGGGLGTSIHRFGSNQVGTGESAVFDIFGEVGLVGGVLYLAAYAMLVIFGLRAWLANRDDPILGSLALVALVGGLALLPITVTSDVYSDFSVTFLLWWTAGLSVSLAGRGRPPA